MIGHDGGEEYYYLDLQQDPPPVMRFDLETGELSTLCEDLGRYVAASGHQGAKLLTLEGAVSVYLDGPLLTVVDA
ncbi:MAG: hypothetical protein ACP5XB_15885 [Isosphaeraceae bacterium]